MTNKVLVVVIILLVIFGIGILLYAVSLDVNAPENPDQTRGDEIDMTGWQTFRSEEYDFSLRYPEDWRMATSGDRIAPKFNFYTGTISAPFDHFGEVANVSIFPLGIPSEGLMARNEPGADRFESGVPFDENSSRIFLLESGEPFAAYLRPEVLPTGWGEAGFIWVRADGGEISARCERNRVIISMEACDPLGLDSQDVIIYSGKVDEEKWDTLKAIVSTIEFTDTREVGEHPLIRVSNPRPNQTVSSPLILRGEARGQWYFEASFPVTLRSANGTVLARVPAQASGEWMTTNFVPFEVSIPFTITADTNATLILEKDNPSGLPEFDDKIEIPIRLRANP